MKNWDKSKKLCPNCVHFEWYTADYEENCSSGPVCRKFDRKGESKKWATITFLKTFHRCFESKWCSK